MSFVKVERSVDVEVSKEVAFNFLRDFINFRKFDPFSVIEKEIKFTTSSPSAGLNAMHHWEGKVTGSGEMKIIEESKNKDYIKMSLDFFVPKGKGNFAYYAIEEKTRDNKTICTITWGLDAKFPFFMSVIKGKMQQMMDKNVGPHYELGLKILAHKLNPSYPQLQFQHLGAIEKPTMQYVGLPYSGVASTDIPKQFEEKVPKYMDFLKANNLPYGPILALYKIQNPKSDIFDGVIGGFVEDSLPSDIKGAENIEIGALGAQCYNIFKFVGEYSDIGRVWGLAFTGSSRFQSKVEKSLPCIEFYVKDDQEKSDAQEVEMWVPISKEKYDAMYK